MSWFLEDDQVKAQGEGAILVLVPPGAAPGGWIRTDTDSSIGPIDVQIPRGVWPYGYFEVQDPKNPYPVTVRFEVPATVAAGDLVQVPRPGGGLVPVRVPAGAKPGDSAEVSLGANYTNSGSVDQVSPEHVSLTERTKQPTCCQCCGDSDMTDFNQHKSGCFVNDCWGFPCFCLKTNRQRAALVLEKFRAVPVDIASPGDAVAVAGRVVATDGVLHAPCSGRQCVYFEVGTGDEGGYYVVTQGVDFSLEAGDRGWLEAGDRGHGPVRSCRVSQKASDGLRATFKHDSRYFAGTWQRGADGTVAQGTLPPALVDVFKERWPGVSWENKTFFEKAFVVGEPLTCLGRLERQYFEYGGNDPQVKLFLTPAARGAADRTGWSCTERRSWNALLAPGRARVLASDDPKHLPEKLRKLEAPLPEAIGERGNPPGGSAGGDVNTTDCCVVCLGAICGG